MADDAAVPAQPCAQEERIAVREELLDLDELDAEGGGDDRHGLLRELRHGKAG
jgi:hypothetical protein